MDGCKLQTRAWKTTRQVSSLFTERSSAQGGHLLIGIFLEIDLPVFSEASTPITEQPQTTTTMTNLRRPIPVSTVDWQSTNASQFIPMHSLDFLIGADQLYIQQSIELNDCAS